MIKPLGSEPIMGICEFAYYRAKKHRNKSDTHSIQQMAVVYIHKQILGLASGLSLHFLTIAPPSIAKKVGANFKNLPWLLRRNNWGPTGAGGRIHAPESPISPCAVDQGGERKQALWSVKIHSLPVSQRSARGLFACACKQISTRKCCQPLACGTLAHAVGREHLGCRLVIRNTSEGEKPYEAGMCHRGVEQSRATGDPHIPLLWAVVAWNCGLTVSCVTLNLGFIIYTNGGTDSPLWGLLQELNR